MSAPGADDGPSEERGDDMPDADAPTSPLRRTRWDDGKGPKISTESVDDDDHSPTTTIAGPTAPRRYTPASSSSDLIGGPRGQPLSTTADYGRYKGSPSTPSSYQQQSGRTADRDRRETVACPQTLVGRLIGKQGETIKDLQRRSGARIQIDQNFPEGHPRLVTVEGEPSCVQIGVELVTQLIGSSPAVGNGAPGRLTTFHCPKSLVGRVIGKGGETINELQRRSGARIQIEQRVPEGQPCVIEVQGEDAAVNEAIRLTTEVMNGKRLDPMPLGGIFPPGSCLVTGNFFPGGPQQQQQQQQQHGGSAGQSPPGATYTGQAYGLQNLQQQMFMSQYPYYSGQVVPANPGGGYYASYAPVAAYTTYGPYAYPTQAMPWQYPPGPSHQQPSPPQSPAPAATTPQGSGGFEASTETRQQRSPLNATVNSQSVFQSSPSGGVGSGGPPRQEGWSSHSDGQGRTYWHNQLTGESTWNAPPGL